MHRGFFYTIFLAILMISLNACQPVVTSTSPNMPTVTVDKVTNERPLANNEDTVVITFACQTSSLKVYQELAEQFNAMYPNIQVDLLDIWDVVDVTTFAPGTLEPWYQIVSAADTAVWDLDPAIFRLGFIKDLSSFLDMDSSFNREDIAPFMWDYFRWDESIWAIPAGAKPTVIFYNKAAFDRVGVSYPHPGWTQDEFLQLAQQLTLYEGEKVIQYGFIDLWQTFYYLPIMDETLPSDPLAAPRLDAPEVAESLRWYTDLTFTHGVMPDPMTLSEDATISFDSLNAPIINGRVAMWTDRLGNKESRINFDSLDIGIAPFPFGTQNANVFTIEAYFMSSGTRYPQESWQWIKFLTEQGIYTQDVSHTTIPARRSVAERNGFWLQWTDTEAEALRFALEHPFAEPRGSSSYGLHQAMNAIWRGQPVEAALAAAQQAALAYYTTQTALPPRKVVVRSPGQPGEERTTLTFASSGLDDTLYRTVAAVFNAQQETLEVNVVSPQELATADCFSGSSDIAQGQGTRHVLNLQPFIDREPTLNLADFAFVDAFRAQGDVYGLPTHTAAAVLYYNQDLFDAAGVAYPQPGWSLDDFLRAAQALTRGAGDAQQYGFIPLDGDAGTLPLFVALHGADLWDAAGQPRFTAPDVVAAVTWYADLALHHGVMPAASASLPDPTPADLQWRETAVKTGRAAMWSALVGLGQSPTRVVPPGGVVGVVPLPGAARALLLPQGLYIAADTPHPEECWQWLTFAATRLPPAPELGIPAYRPTLLADTFTVQVGDNVAATYRALADYASVTQPPGTGGQRRALLEALAAILEGAAPETALAEAQRQAQKR